MDSVQLATFVRLVKNHISVANDLGSWAKEKKAYDKGRVLYLINTAEITRRLLSLPSERAAVAVTYSFQLEIEREIDDEIERLRMQDTLSPDEWRFVDAALHAASANTLVNSIMSRYGGEEARI